MNIRILVLLVMLFLPNFAWASGTLGQATGDLKGRLETLLQARPANLSWGETVAFEDISRLYEACASLEQALQGHEAQQVRERQRELVTAGARVRASWTLRPGASSEELQTIEEAIRAIDGRLGQIRNRFDQKASRTTSSLAKLSLNPVPGDPFSLYDSPQALLIDVRDARRLCQELDTLRYPYRGFGMNTINNLDSLQVRRLTLRAWDLERALESRYDDIEEILKPWQAFHQEYDRLGYPGTSHAARQLDTVVTRLSQFFHGLIHEQNS